VLVPTNVTLTGSSTDVWILEIAQDLTLANGVDLGTTASSLPSSV